MTKYFLYSAYISFLSILVQWIIAPREIMYAAIPVFISSFIVWLFILGKNRFFNIFFVLLAHLGFIAILVYHHFFSDALTLSVAKTQWHEGLYALYQAKDTFIFSNVEKFISLSALLSIMFLWKYRLFPLSGKKKCFLLVIIGGLVFIKSWLHRYEEFSQYEFNITSRYFGYPASWIYEISTASQKDLMYQKLYTKDKTVEFKEFKGIFLPENLYIIQFESLDYSAFDSPAMPFLQSIKSDAAVYKIKPHFKKASANADFQVLMLKSIYDESLGVLYKLVDESYYQKNKSLPKILKEKGYKSYFYHGNDGDFFNRKKVVEQIGFDKIYFKEDLETQYPIQEWGINDQDMIDVINQQAKTGKNLHFFITVSSHFDFSLGKEYTKYISQPQTEREKYLNTIRYTDQGLKSLIQKAPQKSLFIIYSDHESQTDENKTTLLMIYSKSQKISRAGTITMKDIPLIIKQIINQ